MLSGGCSSDASPHSASLRAQVREGPALPFPVAGHVGGIVGGKPVLAGGSSWINNRTTKKWHHESLVFRDGTWVPGPPLPQPLSDSAYAWDAGGLYLAGGTDGSKPTNLVLVWSSVAEAASWRALPPLPETIEAAAGAIAGSTFYVFGGFSGGKASNRLWALDLRSGDATWRQLAALPAPGRAYSSMVAVGSDLILFGGFTSPPYTTAVTIFSEAYRYDIAADRWQQHSDFNLPGYAWTATAIDGKHIMLTGRVAEVGKVSDEIWLVDLTDNSARAMGNLVIPSCCMPAIPVSQGTWWLPGGEPDTNRSRTNRTSIVQIEVKDKNE
jgi:N-acetylneuraminic acid mutarotase